MKETKIAILIPCYNEALTVAKVINDFKKELPSAFIFVCDNNSTDNTFEIAKSNGATVIKESKQGKANAVLKLFRTVCADIYITVDGDDSHPASQVGELIDTFKKNQLDMLVGDRLSNGSYFGENKRLFHNFGNQSIIKLVNTLFNSNQKDILSGYRVFSNRFVKNYTTLIEGFELEADITIFCLNYNLKIDNIPIVHRDRPKESISKLNTYRDGYKILKTIFYLYRFYKPFNFFFGISIVIFMIALTLGVFPVYEFIKYNYVYKVSFFILSGIILLVSVVFFATGIILDNLMKIDKRTTILKIRETK